MTEQQQKLYDKLLKKVNEYCLGAAAEDVIAAIDALVDTYETPLETYRKRMKEWESGHSVDFSKVRFEVQNLLPDPDNIAKKLKTLEIIKKCGENASYIVWCITVHKNYNYFAKTTFAFEGKPSEKEYELLEEVFTNETIQNR